MKRRCKSVDITDHALIFSAVNKCLKPLKRRKSQSAIVWAAEALGISKTSAKKHLIDMDDVYIQFLRKISDSLQKELLEGKIKLAKPYYCFRKDRPTGKIRKLTLQTLRHKLYDYIAVEGLQPLFNTLGYWQCASIPGKGPFKGAATVRKWLKEDTSLRYWCKLDIQKCFESIRAEDVLTFLKRKISNKCLINLIETCITTGSDCLSIGSYLSQWLCNLYLSQLYHFIENLHILKRNKFARPIKRCLFYMDDILLLASNKRLMKRAITAIAIFIQERLHLKIKQNWQLQRVNEQPIAMMGFRILRGVILTGKRNWRLFLRLLYRWNNYRHRTPRLKLHLACIQGWALTKVV